MITKDIFSINTGVHKELGKFYGLVSKKGKEDKFINEIKFIQEKDFDKYELMVPPVTTCGNMPNIKLI